MKIMVSYLGGCAVINTIGDECKKSLIFLKCILIVKYKFSTIILVDISKYNFKITLILALNIQN